MGDYATILISGAKRARAYSELMLQGIDASHAAKKPAGAGGKLIDTNTPSFVYGHLALYPARILTLLGKDASAIAAPEAWHDLFKAGAPCLDDGTSAYPSFSTLTAHYFRATDAAIDTLARTPDVMLLAMHPDEKARANWPNIGSAINFLLSGHVMVHMGQVSAWRRCMGLSAAMA
jgi:hypothetical protein